MKMEKEGKREKRKRLSRHLAIVSDDDESTSPPLISVFLFEE